MQNKFQTIHVATDRSVSLTTELIRPPGPGQVRGRVLAASLCGADLRVLRGTKAVHGGFLGGVAGHEGVLFVDAVGAGVSSEILGQYCIPLPHRYPPHHDRVCPNPQHERYGPRCTGVSCCTKHLGFLAPGEAGGTFTQVLTIEAEQLVTVPRRLVEAAGTCFRFPGVALYSLTEPILCILPNVLLAFGEHFRAFGERLQAGRCPCTTSLAQGLRRDKKRQPAGVLPDQERPGTCSNASSLPD